MKKNPNPLMSAPLYQDQVHDLRKEEKKAQIFFVDETLKPLSVSKAKIAKCEKPFPYKNQMSFLPRKGDRILISGEELYTVADVIHVLPLVHSDVQKVYIVIA